ncbi:MAG: hypothetical protein S4CHLAM2_18350 [Chlamydiales bacterium]|nr:hypothetical protein [Chlamydiales bacterium]
MAFSEIASIFCTKQHQSYEVTLQGGTRMHQPTSATKTGAVLMGAAGALDALAAITLLVVGILAIMGVVPLSPAVAYSLITAGGINAALLIAGAVKHVQMKCAKN